MTMNPLVSFGIIFVFLRHLNRSTLQDRMQRMCRTNEWPTEMAHLRCFLSGHVRAVVQYGQCQIRCKRHVLRCCALSLLNRRDTATASNMIQHRPLWGHVFLSDIGQLALHSNWAHGVLCELTSGKYLQSHRPTPHQPGRLPVNTYLEILSYSMLIYIYW